MNDEVKHRDAATQSQRVYEMLVQKDGWFGTVTILFPNGELVSADLNAEFYSGRAKTAQEAESSAICNCLLKWAQKNWNDRDRWREHLQARKLTRSTAVGRRSSYESILLTILEQPALPTEATQTKT